MAGVAEWQLGVGSYTGTERHGLTHFLKEHYLKVLF